MLSFVIASPLKPASFFYNDESTSIDLIKKKTNRIHTSKYLVDFN